MLDDTEQESDSSIQCGPLKEFHYRLVHLYYDKIVRMAGDPAYGIILTGTKREICLDCAQVKQTLNVQSRKETDRNSPIDVMGRVNSSNLKVPMTPYYRLRNQYVVNFIDHQSTY